METIQTILDAWQGWLFMSVLLALGAWLEHGAETCDEADWLYRTSLASGEGGYLDSHHRSVRREAYRLSALLAGVLVITALMFSFRGVLLLVIPVQSPAAVVPEPAGEEDVVTVSETVRVESTPANRMQARLQTSHGVIELAYPVATGTEMVRLGQFDGKRYACFGTSLKVSACHALVSG